MGGRMSYKPYIEVQYQIAARDELPEGRVVDLQDRLGGQAAVLLDSDHCSDRLATAITRLSGHQVVHGIWRQRWTDDGRMNDPAQGLMVAVSRWERVPGHMLPDGRVVVCIEEEGSSVWLVDEDECTMRAQTEMNELLLRLAGDGLWVQHWIRRRPLPADSRPAPQLTAPGKPLTLP